MKQLIIIVRLISALGALVFSISFFLPVYFYNSPQARFLWAVDAAFPLGDWGMTMAFFGVAAAMVYPYAWAVTAAFTALPIRVERLGGVLQMGCHIFAGVIISVLGAVLIISGDESLPPIAQWTAVLFPPCFILILLLSERMASPSRRWAALTSVGVIPFIPLQVLIARAVVADGGVGWGYYLGTVGGVICLLGCLFVLFKDRR